MQSSLINDNTFEHDMTNEYNDDSYNCTSTVKSINDFI